MDDDATEASQNTSRWSSWSQRDRIVPRTEQLPLTSRWLYRIDHYSSLPMAGVAVGLVLVCAIGVGAALGFSAGWIAAFEVGTSFLTLMMVLVIQHTQGREQAATQRKLDELLRALPGAASGLMMLEEASDDVMRDVELDQRETKKESAADELVQPPADRNPA
jgi:low affinity Fe/Cu permease